MFLSLDRASAYSSVPRTLAQKPELVPSKEHSQGVSKYYSGLLGPVGYQNLQGFSLSVGLHYIFLFRELVHL